MATRADDDELEKESPDTLKRLRTSEKARHTKLMTRIMNHMEERGSRKVFKVYRNQLAEILHECTKLNSLYNQALTGEDNTSDEVWQTEVDTRTNEFFTLIEAHLESRIAEASTTSSISTPDKNPTPPTPAEKETEPKQTELNNGDPSASCSAAKRPHTVIPATSEAPGQTW